MKNTSTLSTTSKKRKSKYIKIEKKSLKKLILSFSVSLLSFFVIYIGFKILLVFFAYLAFVMNLFVTLEMPLKFYGSVLLVYAIYALSMIIIKFGLRLPSIFFPKEECKK